MANEKMANALHAGTFIADAGTGAYLGLQNSLWNPRYGYISNGIRPSGDGVFGPYMQSRYDRYTNAMKDAVNYQNERMAGTMLPNNTYGQGVRNGLSKAQTSYKLAQALPGFVQAHESPFEMGFSRLMANAPKGTALQKMSPFLRIGAGLSTWGMSPIGMAMTSIANRPENMNEYIYHRAAQDSWLPPLNAETPYIGFTTSPALTYAQTNYLDYENNIGRHYYHMQNVSPEEFKRDLDAEYDTDPVNLNYPYQYAVYGKDINLYGPAMYNNWMNQDAEKDYNKDLKYMTLPDEEGNFMDENDVSALVNAGFKPSFDDYKKGDSILSSITNPIYNFLFDSGILNKNQLSDAQWSPDIAIPYDKVAEKIYSDLDNTPYSFDDDPDSEALYNAMQYIK